MTGIRKRVTLVIGGVVQGVWFRASTREEADRLGLTGWVRNLPDGTVEVVAEGTAEALDGLVAWCRQGPPGARVNRIGQSWSAATGEFTSFTVRR